MKYKSVNESISNDFIFDISNNPILPKNLDLCFNNPSLVIIYIAPFSLNSSCKSCLLCLGSLWFIGLAFDDQRTTKNYKRGYLTLRPEGTSNLSVKVYIDNAYISTLTVSQVGGAAVYGTALFGSSYYADQDFVETDFDLGYSGKRIQFEIYNETADKGFLISSLMVDFKPLERKPE